MSSVLVLSVLVLGVFASFCCSGVSAHEYSYENSTYPSGSGRSFDVGNVLSSITNNLMGRGYGTTGIGSQVISLNLTNLLILVLLKALIFAAASLAGHKGGEHYARNADDEDKLLTDEEVLMFLSYLTGSPGDNGCLQNVACMTPKQAKKYVNAGDVLLKAAKMFSFKADDTYGYILKEVDHAANVGIAGGNCQLFKCSNGGKNKV